MKSHIQSTTDSGLELVSAASEDCDQQLREFDWYLHDEVYRT